MLQLPLLLVSATAAAALTQPGLPEGCLGSVQDYSKCVADNWFISTSDPCYPLDGVPRPGQQVYIRDEFNFCIGLPDPDSLYLQENYYNVSALPTILNAEGYIRSFCVGDYLPPKSKAMPAGGIVSAHVILADDYYQVSGLMDCHALNINCDPLPGGGYNDGGQYDNEPYSGVDESSGGNPGFSQWLQQAGEGIFCMRVCKKSTACPFTDDTKGCYYTMNITSIDQGFSLHDIRTNGTGVLETGEPGATWSSRTTTTTLTTAAVTTANATTGQTAAAKTTSSSGGRVEASVALLAMVWMWGMRG
ncbi:hypothetical protein HDU83_006199 [Entophlyctis luteolus]|nr:hypothetical protein HDU83_006199 [Entophlyctis luteolus]